MENEKVNENHEEEDRVLRGKRRRGRERTWEGSRGGVLWGRSGGGGERGVNGKGKGKR